MQILGKWRRFGARAARPTLLGLLLAAALPAASPDPGKAALLSTLFPGLGQFYNGQKLKGAFFLTAGAYFGAQTLYSAYHTYGALRTYRQTGDESDHRRYQAWFRQTMSHLFGYLTVWGYAIADAYVTAHLAPLNPSPQLLFSPSAPKGAGTGGKIEVRLVFHL